MERRRRLRDRLASPAGEPLSNRLRITFHWRGMASKASPADILAELRQLRRGRSRGSLCGAVITIRSRGRCSGNGFRAGRLRSKVLTTVDDEERSALQLVLGGVRLGVPPTACSSWSRSRSLRSERAAKRAPKLRSPTSVYAIQRLRRSTLVARECVRSASACASLALALKPRGLVSEDHRMRCSQSEGRINRPCHIRRESPQSARISQAKSSRPPSDAEFSAASRQSIPSSR